jgi:hypothetical protein
LQATDDLGCVRAKLLNLDTVFSKWNDNVISDNEFPEKVKNLCGSTTVLVEHEDRGSLT